MAIKYYKLFDLLNRRGIKISKLRSVISSATIAKINKHEIVSIDTIDKICAYLQCQPNDIMEYVQNDTDGNDIAIYYDDDKNVSDVNIYEK